ncbi:MAG: hypothetical protein O7A64_08860 [Alphaproteobacteria bacterium]|nr:hypothetical protein [Alphaproteobacteria bacterium]
MAKVDRDRAAQVVGHERGFTFRVYDPEGIDVAGLREVVEAVKYEGLRLLKGGNGEIERDGTLTNTSRQRVGTIEGLQ